MVDISQIQQWRQTLPKGFTITRSSIKEFIMSHQRKGSETTLIEPKSPCKNTVDLYLQECLHDDSIPSRVLTSAYNKTVQRFVAENSHRAVIMMTIVVLIMTHAIPIEDKSKECSGTLEDKLVWYPHFWVNPALCWNSDDTTYASAALKTKGIRVYIQKLCDTSAHFSTFGNFCDVPSRKLTIAATRPAQLCRTFPVLSFIGTGHCSPVLERCSINPKK